MPKDNYWFGFSKCVIILENKTKQAGAEQCQAQEKLWRAYLWWSSRVDGWGLSLQIGATTDPQTPQPLSKPLPND